MTDVISKSETPLPPSVQPLDSGLAGLALVAGYYRIAADPMQLRHQLALTGRPAGAEDMLKAISSPDVIELQEIGAADAEAAPVIGWTKLTGYFYLLTDDLGPVFS